MNEKELKKRFVEVTSAINGCTVNDGCFVLTMALGGILATLEPTDEEAKEFANEVAQDVLEAYKNFKEKGGE
jgi:hypothetical protein